MTKRVVQGIIRAMPASDGAGVKLMRSLGQSNAARLDPFLMLDCFSSEEASDYIAGFPAHPHRGFETVTYMLDGHMRHEDHLGNVGELRSGGAQWMTAGRGIIHSEMPQQESGRMRGFQLWINLPAAEKMKPAGYRDIQADQIPVAELPGGGKVKVVAGSSQGVTGPIDGVSTQPLMIDVDLPAGQSFTQAVPEGHNAFVYAYEGKLVIAGELLSTHQAAILSPGSEVEISAHEGPAKFLMLAAKPLREPVVQYGPFVMTSREEIEQAIHDYQTGNFVEA
ncbi:MAG TPA: pirin family protein [Magnetospirillaceae bacterium]|nr:pirin family protein [Magnetospirillaceae bacterium]